LRRAVRNGFGYKEKDAAALMAAAYIALPDGLSVYAETGAIDITFDDERPTTQYGMPYRTI
jgi:hypothetical protein